MYKFYILLVVGFLLTGCGMFEKYEEPPFTVEKKDAPFEIRKYQPYLVAEVIIGSNRDDAANEAFRYLFKYISGHNVPKENLAMTIPVTQQQKDGGWAVRFIMPSSKSLDTLPKPDDNRITLRQERPGKVLAIVFSGSSSQSNLDTHLEKLRSYARSQHIKTNGEPVYAFYNSPFSLPFMRRNEILLAMEP